MKMKLQNREKGFTIIEVLIVLAIAGLIILIVFLAVPALQRTSRNTQRSNDASAVGGAVNECLSNRNGQIDSCDQVSELRGLDTTKLRQLTTVNIGAAVPMAPGDNSSINVGYGARCKTDGSDTQAGTPRQAVAMYLVETSGGGSTGDPRCLEI